MSEQVTASDRKAVYTRDGFRCVAGGGEEDLNECEGPLTIQHRADRGMGGTSIRVPLCGLVTMCWKHNLAASHDAQFMAIASRLGWKLKRSEDPSQVSIFYRWRREWVLIDLDGTERIVEHRDPECYRLQEWATEGEDDVKVAFTRVSDWGEVGP